MSGPGVSVAERASAVRASSADRWARGHRERGRRAGVSGPEEGSAAGLEQRLAGWRAVRESGPSGGGWPAGRASGGGELGRGHGFGPREEWVAG